MDDSQNDIFQKLEEAVERWGAEMADAHQGLAAQLERTRVTLDAATDTPSAGLGALDETIARFTEAARESSEAIAELKESIRELRGELTSVRGEMAELRAQLEGARAPEPVQLEPSRIPEETAKAWEEVARLGAQLDDPPRPAGQDVPPDVVMEAFDESGSRRRIGEILLAAGVITAEQLQEALDAQEREPHRRLGSILVERGFTGETAIALVLASQLKTRFVHLHQEPIDPEAFRLISPRVARRHECVPLRATPDRLIMAMANPFDLIAIDDVELATGRRVDPVVATATDIHRTLDRLR